MIVKINNGQAEKYPYHWLELTRDNSGVSFPLDLSGVDLSDFGAAHVVTTDPPLADEGTRVDQGLPVLSDGKWVQTWVVSSI